ncbi:MAG: hypothetical protein HEP71_17095 [Roseivirga sp.]|nr:hypothetical protein [Roseivirga sp.]
MKPWKARLKDPAYFLAIAVTAFLAVYLTMPQHEFKYNPDVGNSPYGMAIAKTYQNMPENTGNWARGYVLNGELTIYANWPPMAFKLLAEWFEFTGRDDIYTARIWYALLYAINALLFYALLKGLKVNTAIAFIASISFIFLPSHLDFGALIYVDQWLITFWLLAWIAYFQDKVLSKILFYIIVLSGFLFFHWFIIFLLPIPFLLFLLKRYRPGIGRLTLILVAVMVIVWAVQYSLFSLYKDSYFFQKFRVYSIFGLASVPGSYPVALLKRIVSLGYEAAVLVPLFLLAGFFSVRHKHFIKWPQLYSLLSGNLLALISYTICFVHWFGYHRHGLGMFSILIGGAVALGLSYLKSRSLPRFRYACVLVILVPLSLFMALPAITKVADEVEQQDEQIANFINANRTSQDLKACLFFDQPGIAGTHIVRFDLSEFALREYTNAYTFNLYEMEKQVSITEDLKHGIAKLKKNGFVDFDPSLVFMVSKKHYEFDETVITGLNSIGKFNIYHLDLTDF